MRVVNGVLQQPEAWQNFATQASAVTPSDTVALPDVTRFLYVGGAGDLTVIMAEDSTLTPITFKAVPVGTVLPLAVSLVHATLTTATLIVAMY